MRPAQSYPNHEKPVIGESACGARICITASTPYIHYRDETIYFCSLDCKELYDEDPLSSCMAARLLSGR